MDDPMIASYAPRSARMCRTAAPMTLDLVVGNASSGSVAGSAELHADVGGARAIAILRAADCASPTSHSSITWYQICCSQRVRQPRLPSQGVRHGVRLEAMRGCLG